MADDGSDEDVPLAARVMKAPAAPVPAATKGEKAEPAKKRKIVDDDGVMPAFFFLF